MIKLQVEGDVNQVQPFLAELKNQPNITLFNGEPAIEDENGVAKCSIFVNYVPSRQIQLVHLNVKHGEKIFIPLLKVVNAEIEEGKWHLSGWNYDIFAG